MRRASRFTLTAALTSALALVAAPALANGSGQTVDMPPWQWYIAAGSGEWGVTEGSFSDGNTSRGNAWDVSEMTFLGPDYMGVSSASSLEQATPSDYVRFACDSTTLTTSAPDQVVTCDQTVTTPWGLSVTSDVRILDPGDLARITFFVTNTTNAPVALGYRYSWEYGESRVHVRSSQPTVEQVTAGENPGGVLGTPDVWSFNGGDGTLNAGVAWGTTGNPLLATASEHFGYDQAWVTLLPADNVTVTAGETVAIAFFHILDTPPVFIDNPDEVSGPAAAPGESTEAVEEAATPQPAVSGEPTTIAAIMAEFASFDGRLTRGLPNNVTVGNWQPAATADPDPELADTGAGFDEQLLMGGIAAALLGAGAALIAIRRVAVRPARR